MTPTTETHTSPLKKIEQKVSGILSRHRKEVSDFKQKALGLFATAVAALALPIAIDKPVSAASVSGLDGPGVTSTPVPSEAPTPPVSAWDSNVKAISELLHMTSTSTPSTPSIPRTPDIRFTPIPTITLTPLPPPEPTTEQTIEVDNPPIFPKDRSPEQKFPQTRLSGEAIPSDQGDFGVINHILFDSASTKGITETNKAIDYIAHTLAQTETNGFAGHVTAITNGGIIAGIHKPLSESVFGSNDTSEHWTEVAKNMLSKIPDEDLAKINYGYLDALTNISSSEGSKLVLYLSFGIDNKDGTRSEFVPYQRLDNRDGLLRVNKDKDGKVTSMLFRTLKGEWRLLPTTDLAAFMATQTATATQIPETPTPPPPPATATRIPDTATPTPSPTTQETPQIKWTDVLSISNQRVDVGDGSHVSNIATNIQLRQGVDVKISNVRFTSDAAVANLFLSGENGNMFLVFTPNNELILYGPDGNTPVYTSKFSQDSQIIMDPSGKQFKIYNSRGEPTDTVLLADLAILKKIPDLAKGVFPRGTISAVRMVTHGAAHSSYGIEISQVTQDQVNQAQVATSSLPPPTRQPLPTKKPNIELPKQTSGLIFDCNLDSLAVVKDSQVIDKPVFIEGDDFDEAHDNIVSGVGLTCQQALVKPIFNVDKNGKKVADGYGIINGTYGYSVGQEIVIDGQPYKLVALKNPTSQYWGLVYFPLPVLH